MHRQHFLLLQIKQKGNCSLQPLAKKYYFTA